MEHIITEDITFNDGRLNNIQNQFKTEMFKFYEYKHYL